MDDIHSGTNQFLCGDRNTLPMSMQTNKQNQWAPEKSNCRAVPPAAGFTVFRDFFGALSEDVSKGKICVKLSAKK